MDIKKYQVNNPLLQKLIKYFWVIDSNHNLTINHKLLPVGNIDLIINLSSPIKYTSKKESIATPTGIHFNGLRKSYHWINQNGPLYVIGISLSPLGAYPLLKAPLCEFADLTVELESVDYHFDNTLKTVLDSSYPISVQLNMIEEVLIQSVDTTLISSETTQVFDTFSFANDTLPIHNFCEKSGIHPRKLERYFNSYIGVSPKSFRRLHRFQKLLGQIIKNDYDDMTMLAYEFNYYDQTHFLKDFKSFTGCSPSQFLLDRASIKQIMQ